MDKEKYIMVEAKVPLRLEKVESSQIEAVGYAPIGKTLIIKFNKGGVYTYKPVTKEQFENLMKAPSIGKFFNGHIKDNAGIIVEKQL